MNYNKFKREKVMELRNNGYSISKIVKLTGFSKSSCHRAITYVKNKNTTDNLPRGKKKTFLTDELIQIIKSLALKFSSIAEITREINLVYHRKISVATISKYLRKCGLREQVIKKNFFTSEQIKMNRLYFAKACLNWTINDWSKIVFSGQTTINLFSYNNKKNESVFINENLTSKCMTSSIKQQNDKIILWGCMSYIGVGPLIRFEGF